MSVSADSQNVPADQACSLDFVYASGGSSHRSSSSPNRSTARSASDCAVIRSVATGRCGPCCSMAPVGRTSTLSGPRAAVSAGAVSSVSSRVGTPRTLGRPRCRPVNAACTGVTRPEHAAGTGRAVLTVRDALAVWTATGEEAAGRRRLRGRRPDHRRPQRPAARCSTPPAASSPRGWSTPTTTCCRRRSARCPAPAASRWRGGCRRWPPPTPRPASTRSWCTRRRRPAWPRPCSAGSRRSPTTT